PGLIIGNEIKAGKNQYGKAHELVWQNGDINLIGKQLSATVEDGMKRRLNRQAFTSPIQNSDTIGKCLTYLPMPEGSSGIGSVQLGLFDLAAVQNSNRASAYLNNLDNTIVDKQSVRILNLIKTGDKPEHEAIVMLAAKSLSFKQYVYKLYSNVAEIQFPANWMNASTFHNELKKLPERLQEFNHRFYNEGETGFHISIKQDKDADLIKEPNPYHKEGTLIIHNSRVGFLSYAAGNDIYPAFTPSLHDKKDLSFYEQYTSVRDAYLLLYDKELVENVEHPELRKHLNDSYDALVRGYGILNAPTNRQRVLKDEAFGLVMLSSLERKEGEQFLKADILTQSFIQKQEVFRTDDPTEALARSLNEKGLVDIDYIAAAIGTTEAEAVQALSNHIYLNPINNQWETADKFLSGNVVVKLQGVRGESEKKPGSVQLKRSLEALQKVQPERIPFELLDFNLGERWIPLDYYNQFASGLFELPAEVNYFSSVDSFKVKTNGINAKTNQEYAVTTKSGKTTYGHTLLEHALENTTPFYTYEVDLGDRKVRV
ncbi:MAG: DNA methylase, partial [Flavisolibacter sp.]|nr:DNA methylase [Flavisolibacter sp.]